MVHFLQNSAVLSNGKFISAVFYGENIFKIITSVPDPGLPDFPWPKHAKTGKIYQMTTNYTNWP
jgi:hypothetical protein